MQNVPLSIDGQGGDRRNGFAAAVVRSTGGPLRAAAIRTMQVNIGLVCNLACHHCHVESGPKRREEMTWETMELVLAAARVAGSGIIDITGGAPEMNPWFRRFVIVARREGHVVLVRTNLTIMLEEGYQDLPRFLSEQRVHLIASLPCYLESNVDRQRGRHVYVDSIEVLQKLNGEGYGIEPDLPLDLVYNPGGPTLPPAQESLEEDYRRELAARFGIRFTRLLTITNMPIGRFQHDLDRSGRGDAYRDLLRDAFNPTTIDALMCRHQIHVSWDGTLHDCDFNYAIGLPNDRRAPRHIREFDADRLRERLIVTDEHCFGCTAGCGSSCGGALT
ncbi:MAG: arsenosugar biosynthesis radical SAM protein ArsS [Phycisphaeraceae bacterium]|nr:arsenosugar biosynthesis radical SAM protein ArsS [Phycisphaeraceae bacterium]